MPTQRIYALMVAINDYPIDRHRLNGCINDRDALHDFLQRKIATEPDLELYAKLLTNEEATRDNIVRAFEWFTQARKEDICLFYYSGHGSRAAAPEAFWHLSPDRMNESIVCYDSRLPHGRDLMDKEISFLFWQATRGRSVHFLSVFDCCHAGTVSKDPDIRSRMAEPSHTPAREEDYLGFEAYQVVTDPEGRRRLTPPQGDYVQLAASLDQETAKEMLIDGQSRGIFTYHLIELLEQKDVRLSYDDLVQQLRVKVSNRVREQTPNLLATKPAYKKRAFLGGALPKKPHYYLIQHDSGQWRMNAGRIQGIPESGGTLRLLDHDRRQVRIRQVGANEAFVEGMNALDPGQAYRAEPDSIPFPRVKIGAAEESDERAIAIIQGLLRDGLEQYLQWTTRSGEADYLVHTVEGAYALTLQADDRPLFRRVTGFNEAHARYFLYAVIDVARWRLLLDLENANHHFAPHEVDVQLLRTTDPGNHEDDGPAEPVEIQGVVELPYLLGSQGWQEPGLRVKIKNNGSRKLYASALYLQNDFGITNQFLPLEKLDAGQETWMFERLDSGQVYQTLVLRLEDKYQELGITEITEYLKIIVTTDPRLSTDTYNQNGLPLDGAIALKKGAGRRQNKPEVPDWMTITIPLRIIRPADKQALSGKKAVSILPDVEIEAPAGFEGQISFSSPEEATRFIGGHPPAPPGNVLFDDGQSYLTSYSFNKGINQGSGAAVFEISNPSGADSVSPEHPMRIRLEQREGEFILPIGYDEATGRYFPLGSNDEDGNILIESLPEPTPDRTRSLGGSLKIFFQKAVLQNFGWEYDYPQLAMAEFKDQETFTYVTYTEKVRACLAGARRIALFIHGIIGDTREMPHILKAISVSENVPELANFDLILTFDYENLKTPIEKTAKDLQQRLREVGLEPGHDKELTIIAHSMGGLVSRWYIEKMDGQKVVKQLIMYGTPNGGSPWATLYEFSSFIVGRAITGISFLKPYMFSIKLLGRFAKQLFTTLKQMKPSSDFLSALNDGTDPRIPYVVIAGDTQLLPLGKAEKRLLEKLLEKFKEKAYYESLTQLIFREPNDIAASVDSIHHLEGREGWDIPPILEIIPSDHIMYFDLPDGQAALKKALGYDTSEA